MNFEQCVEVRVRTMQDIIKERSNKGTFLYIGDLKDMFEIGKNEIAGTDGTGTHFFVKHEIRDYQNIIIDTSTQKDKNQNNIYIENIYNNGYNDCAINAFVNAIALNYVLEYYKNNKCSVSADQIRKYVQEFEPTDKLKTGMRGYIKHKEYCSRFKNNSFKAYGTANLTEVKEFEKKTFNELESMTGKGGGHAKAGRVISYRIMQEVLKRLCTEYKSSIEDIKIDAEATKNFSIPGGFTTEEAQFFVFMEQIRINNEILLTESLEAVKTTFNAFINEKKNKITQMMNEDIEAERKLKQNKEKKAEDANNLGKVYSFLKDCKFPIIDFLNTLSERERKALQFETLLQFFPESAQKDDFKNAITSLGKRSAENVETVLRACDTNPKKTFAQWQQNMKNTQNLAIVCSFLESYKFPTLKFLEILTEEETENLKFTDLIQYFPENDKRKDFEKAAMELKNISSASVCKTLKQWNVGEENSLSEFWKNKKENGQTKNLTIIHNTLLKEGFPITKFLQEHKNLETVRFPDLNEYFRKDEEFCRATTALKNISSKTVTEALILWNEGTDQKKKPLSYFTDASKAVELKNMGGDDGNKSRTELINKDKAEKNAAEAVSSKSFCCFP